MNWASFIDGFLLAFYVGWTIIKAIVFFFLCIIATFFAYVAIFKTVLSLGSHL